MALLRAALANELEGTPYEGVRSLALGGMGEVIVVRHRALGHQAVMKLIRAPKAGSSDELSRRLLTEGRVVKGLRHPNIVEVLDFGATPSGRPYLVSELLQGRTLKEELHCVGPLSIKDALGITADILLALDHAHTAGVVHRDIKPDNVMWLDADATGKRVVKLLDFGIVKILNQQVRDQVGAVVPTAEGMWMGTPAYAAPEQIAAKHVDARTDLYAVGGVLFFLLTGRAPFLGQDLNEVLAAQLSETPDPPSRLRDEVPAHIDAVVLRALSKQPEDRFASAAEMRAALSSTAPARQRAATELMDAATVPMARAQVAQIVAGHDAASAVASETRYESSPLPREVVPAPAAPSVARRPAPQRHTLASAGVSGPSRADRAARQGASRAQVVLMVIAVVVLASLVVGLLVLWSRAP